MEINPTTPNPPKNQEAAPAAGEQKSDDLTLKLQFPERPQEEGMTPPGWSGAVAGQVADGLSPEQQAARRQLKSLEDKLHHLLYYAYIMDDQAARLKLRQTLREIRRLLVIIGPDHG